ncbi:far-red impaired response 1 -like protein [Gossypium arboreum]|uniref:Protein FAR1-RELATED SEQUENCE n=1 Tax=Gossypium arboreum TaxID=29729 RepID=A0A0B0NR12_GOSAR|nr:far-red impaired response 1 -like protein [Gossypium arboreum]
MKVGRDAMPCNDGVNENMVDIVDETARSRDSGIVDTSKRAVVGFEGDAEFEPHNGIEFESHEAAYSFYQEYAKSMGFTTSIKNSRRSKKSKEFIDAKFACSRYGVTPESDVGSSRRSSVKKTDCKASMHVKRRPDGKWIIHEFVKEHNHELLPALAYHFRIYRNVKLAEKNNIDILNAVSERTRKIFQVEVLGVVGCHPKRENENQGTIPFRVQDCEKDENFMVIWNEEKSEVSCSCRLFEYRGFLCRHAMIVLQMCGRTSIPPRYILKRWTKDAKSGQSTTEGTDRVQTRVQRYNDLCKHAIELSEEGSLSEESYNIAFCVLVEALKNCVNVNNSCISAVESTGHAQGLREAEEKNQGSLASKSSKKKSTNRKRKGQSEPALMFVDTQDSLQPMENLSSDGITLNGYYGAQQNVQGLVQLNLMEPPHDGYYVNQQSMQGLGQLNSMAPGHDSFFGTQQSMHGLGQLDYRPSASFTYALQDESQLRSTQLHGGVSRHP